MEIKKNLLEYTYDVPFSLKDRSFHKKEINQLKKFAKVNKAISCTVACKKLPCDLDNVLFNFGLNIFNECKWLSIAKIINTKEETYKYSFMNNINRITHYEWDHEPLVSVENILICDSAFDYYCKFREKIVQNYSKNSEIIKNEDSRNSLHKYGLCIFINSENPISEEKHIKPIIDGFTAALQDPFHLLHKNKNRFSKMEDLKGFLKNTYCNLLQCPNAFVFKNSGDCSIKLNPRDDFYYEIIVEKRKNIGNVSVKLFELHDTTYTFSKSALSNVKRNKRKNR